MGNGTINSHIPNISNRTNVNNSTSINNNNLNHLITVSNQHQPITN